MPLVGRRCRAAKPANQSYRIVCGVALTKELFLSAIPARTEQRTRPGLATLLPCHDGKPAGLPYQFLGHCQDAPTGWKSGRKLER